MMIRHVFASRTPIAASLQQVPSTLQWTNATASSSRAIRCSSSSSSTLHYPVIPKFDHGEYQEYSVIHTDRSLNLMSDPFQRVMRDLNLLLKTTYNAAKVAIIPGYVKQIILAYMDFD
jgi:hypothetical protein